jgi:hypothetical protein
MIESAPSAPKVVGGTTDGAAAVRTPSGRLWRRPRAWDLLAPAVYIVVAVFYLGHLWRDPVGRALALNSNDSALFEWMFAHGARLWIHPANPLATTRINPPTGVNLIANTSVLGISLPLAPVTLIFGSAVSLVFAITLGLAGTATAWYFVFSRHLVTSRPAAAVGAALAGFSPGMLSQANGHIQIIFQVLIPIICWRVLVLTRTTRPVRDGVILGLLVAYQVFIGEEVLLSTALALLVATIVYAFSRPGAARAAAPGFLRGLAVAVGVAVPLLAYPLWLQFDGPQSYSTIPPGSYGADLASYPSWSGLTLGGSQSDLLANAHLAPNVKRHLVANTTEVNTFFGAPLLVLLAAVGAWLWRDLAARIATVVLIVFVIASLGSPLVVWDHDTRVPLPWALFARLPLMETMITSRFALVAAVAAGALVALALSRLGQADQWAGRRRGWLRAALAIGVAVSLVPLVPRPTPWTALPAMPAYLADGGWRPALAPGRSLLVIPPTNVMMIESMRWAARLGLEYPATDGYILHPNPHAKDRRAMYLSALTPTEALLSRASVASTPPPITPGAIAQAASDLRARDVGLVFLPAAGASADRVLPIAEQLFGPATPVDGGWIWRVA